MATDNTMEITLATDITSLLGSEASSLLEYRSTTFDASDLHLPGPDYIDRVFTDTDRPIPVVRNLQNLFDHGRLGGSGYISILPVDQGIEHTAGASFAPNPRYFDPANIVELAIEAGCSGVASTMGVLAATARKYAHKIPYIAKLNHNELLTYPNKYDQVAFGSVKRAFEMGCTGVGATIYFGSHTCVSDCGKAESVECFRIHIVRQSVLQFSLD